MIEGCSPLRRRNRAARLIIRVADFGHLPGRARMSSAQSTTNHDTIRKWVEKHGGHPAVVRTGSTGGVLRIDFDEPGGNDDTRLERIGWDEFFRIFDDSAIAFLHGEGESRFNKFVEKESAGG
jgi:hypothetical protein